MEKTEENQKTYELGYILLPTIVENKIGEEASSVITTIESHGRVASSGIPEKKKLEYDISKIISNKKIVFSSGYFGFIIFQTEVSDLINIKTELEKNENILRFILINRNKSSLVVEKKRAFAQPKHTSSVNSSDKKVLSNKPDKEVKINEEELDKTIEDLVIS